MKRIIAILMCCAVALSCAACGKTQTSGTDINDIVITGPDASGAENSSQSLTYATDGDVSYASALYILFMQDVFRQIQDAYDLDYTAVTAATVKLSDGTTTTGSERIRQYADGEFRWLYVIEGLYREAGLSAESSSFYNQAVYYAGQTYKEAPDYYKYFSITMSDLLQYYMYSYEYNDLFYHTYGQGGEKEIAEGELETLMEDGSYRLQYAYLPYYDTETNEALPSAEIAARRDMAGDYLARYHAGESFEDIVYENYLFLDPSTTRGEDTSYDYYVAKSGGSFPQELVDAAASLGDGEAKVVETGDYAAVVLRLPVNENHTAAWRSAALQLAYGGQWGTEFDTYMLGQYNGTQIAFDQKAVDLLTPENYVKLLDGYYASAAN